MIIAKVGGKCDISHFPREYVLVNATHPTLLMVPIFQQGDSDIGFIFLQRSGSSPRYSSWRISKVRFCCVCRLDYHLNPNTSLLESCKLTMSRYLFQNLSTKTTIYITLGLAKDISEPKTSVYYSRGCGIIKAKAVKAYCRNRRSSMTVYEAKTRRRPPALKKVKLPH